MTADSAPPRLDPHVRRLLGMVAASAGSADPQDIARRRADFAKLMSLSGIAPPVARVEDRSIPGPGGSITVRVYTPAGGEGGPLPGLVFFHGGGLVAGSLETHDTLARALANEAQARVVAIDYRLAPEHPFPAGLADCTAALHWVLRHGAEIGIAGPVGVIGESAGATLAALVSHQAAGEPGPSFQFLLCPITDFASETESRRRYARGYLVDAEMIAADLAHYLPAGVSPADPGVSPLRAADLGGACPTYIHTAEADPLHDEGAAYADKLRQAGVRVHYTCHPGMIHLFYAMSGAVPYARTALTQIGAQIRDAFETLAGPAARPSQFG